MDMMLVHKMQTVGLVCVFEKNLEHFIIWEIKEANGGSSGSCQKDSGLNLNSLPQAKDEELHSS